MSNLKHMSEAELASEMFRIDQYIKRMQNKIAGQRERRAWAEKYLEAKLSPKSLEEKYCKVQQGHERFPQSQWFNQVRHGVTLLGYWEWLSKMLREEAEKGAK